MSAAAAAAAAAVAMKEEEEEVAAAVPLIFFFLKVVPLIISGYRFLPTDLELVRDYLCKKITNQKLPSDVPVVEYDVYSTEPWNLPVNNKIDTIDSNRSYYFVKLMEGIDRRHIKRIVLNHSNNSNGVVVVGGGYWKKIAGGRDTRYIRDELYKSIGVKKSFAFHAYLSSPASCAPCHTINNNNNNNIASTAMSTWKTKWIMDEYSLNSQRTQPWVLCILRRKGGEEEDDEVELLLKLKQVKQQQQQQQPAAISIINHDYYPERELKTLENIKTIQKRIKANQIEIWKDQQQLRFLNNDRIQCRMLKYSKIMEERRKQVRDKFSKADTFEELEEIEKQFWERKGRLKAELEAEIAVIQAGSYYVVHLPSCFKKRRRKN